MAHRDLFRKLEKYAVYYGAKGLDRLARYDMVVVEPARRTSEEIQMLQDNGTVVLAYVSVMEVHPAHPLWHDLVDSDYLRSGEAPHDYFTQAAYNNRMMDLTVAHWQGLLLRHIGQLLTRDGYDGVFLDTIGDVEIPGLPRQARQIAAAVSLVEQVRKWFKSAIIVQNNGLELLCLRTAPYIDGIVWENPPVHLPESKHWVASIADRLTHLRLMHNLRILVLFEGELQDSRIDFIRARRFSDEYGFTAHFAPQHYQGFHS